MAIKNDIEVSELDVAGLKNSEIITVETIEKNKPVHLYKNNTIIFINQFYENFYSLNNLGMKEGIIYAILWLIVTSLAIYSTIYLFPLNFISEQAQLFISYGLFAVITRQIRVENEKNIIKSYNKNNSTNFQTVYEVKNNWLCKKLGENYATIENIKLLEEWKTYREKYPMFYTFPWKKYTYTSEAKPRIISLTIASLSVLGLIVFNIFKPQNPDEFIGYIHAIFHTPQVMVLIITILVLVIIGFYSLVYSWDLLKNLFLSFPFLTSSNKLSEAKYKKLLSFLVHKLEVNQIEKDK